MEEKIPPPPRVTVVLPPGFFSTYLTNPDGSITIVVQPHMLPYPARVPEQLLQAPDEPCPYQDPYQDHLYPNLPPPPLSVLAARNEPLMFDFTSKPFTCTVYYKNDTVSTYTYSKRSWNPPLEQAIDALPVPHTDVFPLVFKRDTNRVIHIGRGNSEFFKLPPSDRLNMLLVLRMFVPA